MNTSFDSSMTMSVKVFPVTTCTLPGFLFLATGACDLMTGFNFPEQKEDKFQLQNSFHCISCGISFSAKALQFPVVYYGVTSSENFMGALSLKPFQDSVLSLLRFLAAIFWPVQRKKASRRSFNPLQPGVAFLYFLKISKDPKVFWCF